MIVATTTPSVPTSMATVSGHPSPSNPSMTPSNSLIHHSTGMAAGGHSNGRPNITPQTNTNPGYVGVYNTSTHGNRPSYPGNQAGNPSIGSPFPGKGSSGTVVNQPPHSLGTTNRKTESSDQFSGLFTNNVNTADYFAAIAAVVVMLTVLLTTVAVVICIVLVRKSRARSRVSCEQRSQSVNGPRYGGKANHAIFIVSD